MNSDMVKYHCSSIVLCQYPTKSKGVDYIAQDHIVFYSLVIFQKFECVNSTMQVHYIVYTKAKTRKKLE